VRRGEIWLANLDPTFGTEASKLRPCVIVSNDDANRAVEKLSRGVVTVVPLTTNTKRIYPFQVLVTVDDGNGLAADSKAQAEQIRALDFTRFAKRLGVLSTEMQAALDDALLTHLALT